MFMPKDKVNIGVIISPILVVTGFLALLYLVPFDYIFWGYLFWFLVFIGIINLFYVASVLVGRERPGMRGRGMPGLGGLGAVGAPFKWLGDLFKRGGQKALDKTAEVVERRGSLRININSPRPGQAFGRDDVIGINADITGGTGNYFSSIRFDGALVYDKVPSAAHLYVRVGTPNELNIPNGTHYIEMDTIDARFLQIPGHMRIRVPIEVVGGPHVPQPGQLNPPNVQAQEHVPQNQNIIININ